MYIPLIAHKCHIPTQEEHKANSPANKPLAAFYKP